MARLLRILSIDGGGIRGIIPARVLVEVERKLQHRTGDPRTRLVDYFDLIAGTSTGGILTCLYLTPDAVGATSARPKYAATDALGLYLKHGPHIFSRGWRHRIESLWGLRGEKFPAEGLETQARRYFGELRLRQLLKPCLITAYDIERRKAHFFTQHDASTPGRDFIVRDVVRATAAAPTYFACTQMESDTGIAYPLVDGGVFANNPALCAYAEARSGLPRARRARGGAGAVAPTAKDMLILSLGTGQLSRAYEYALVRRWGRFQWAQPLIDIMMAGVSETVDYQLRQIYDAALVPDQYVRIQTGLRSAQEPWDDASSDNLKTLERLGTELAQDEASRLDRVVDRLVESTGWWDEPRPPTAHSVWASP